MTQPSKTDLPKKDFPVTEEKPFKLLNLTFASKKVFTDFILTSFLIIVVPILFVAIANSYVKNNPDLSELMKVGIVIGPTIVYMNIIIGIYIYRAIKDPENYKVDPPIKIKPKKQ